MLAITNGGDLPNAPLLSVVTVTREDAPGLRRTLLSLRSVVSQAGADIEVLIVDGGAGENASAIVAEFPWAQIESGPDEGVYDAMNKGLRRSRGAFVWFLNGGDECQIESWPAICRELTEHPDHLLLGAYLLRVGDRDIRRSARSPRYIWHALPTSHQAILYPGDMARSGSYDQRFKICADYQFTAQLLVDGVPALKIRELLARFHVDGVSFIDAKRVAREAGVIQREILQARFPSRAVSRFRHWGSRTIRGLQSRFWSSAKT